MCQQGSSLSGHQKCTVFIDHAPREGQATLLSPMFTPYQAQLILYFPVLTHTWNQSVISCIFCSPREDLCEIWARHRSKLSRQGKPAAICIYELFSFSFLCVCTWVWNLHIFAIWKPKADVCAVMLGPCLEMCRWIEKLHQQCWLCMGTTSGWLGGMGELMEHPWVPPS